jgi:hypothetical protein
MDSCTTQASLDEDKAADIYQKLAKHQRNENWPNRQRLAQFQAWGERYSVHFKLDVSEIALCLDILPVTCFGHFRVGHNGFGLKGEIAINARYLEVRPIWQVLGTLLHEHLHAWQHVHGNPSKHDHHNLEFRRKAAEFGLLIDRRGVTDYLLESPFMDLLKAYGVEVPTEAEDDDASEERGRLVRRMLGRPGRMRGKSSLAKWKCDCSSVRCGKADLRARCLKCGKEFRREEEPPSHGADKPTPNAD